MVTCQSCVVAAAFGITLVLATSVDAETKVWRCHAVDVLADVTGDTELLSVNVFGSKSQMKCHFVINLVTKTQNTGTKNIIKGRIDDLELLKKFGDIQPSSRDEIEFRLAIDRIANSMALLLGLPNLKEGQPPEELRFVIEQEIELFTKCFEKFYSGFDPEEEVKQISCKVDKTEGKVLESSAIFDDESYKLWVFR